MCLAISKVLERIIKLFLEVKRKHGLIDIDLAMMHLYHRKVVEHVDNVKGCTQRLKSLGRHCRVHSRRDTSRSVLLLYIVLLWHEVTDVPPKSQGNLLPDMEIAVCDYECRFQRQRRLSRGVW
jgi:hypothetical protein